MEWQFEKYETSIVTRLAEALKLPPILAHLLVKRGIRSYGEAQNFLCPALKTLPNPSLLPDLGKAADRLIRAVSDQELITVYGDYDADGLTASTLLTDFLDQLGARVNTYIPHRLEEGYGLNGEAVESLAESGTKLIVTVDCGITDFEAVNKAGSLGVDVIITDHHQVSSRLPAALAVVNPQRKDSDFPQKTMAGVGVAFFLAGGIRQAIRERGSSSPANLPDLAAMLDLVAIGTVADVMPLTKVNRILVSAGLCRLAEPVRPGIIALKELGALTHGQPVTSHDVAFRLAPRLNAAGRLGSAQPGLNLLLTKDSAQARVEARELDSLNDQRRRHQDDTIKEALHMLELEEDMGQAIVLAKEGWRRGVVGLAASKLAEKYHRPAILLAIENGLALGSGRSIKGFNLYKALEQCQDYMVRFGGHKQAAGLAVEAQLVTKLAEAFQEIAAREIDPSLQQDTLTVDAEVGIEDLDRLPGQIQCLAPFGEGNPDPVFAVRGLDVLSAGCVGRNHLKLRLKQNGRILDTIGFGLGHLFPELGKRVAVALQPYTNTYRGKTTQTWKVIDVNRETL